MTYSGILQNMDVIICLSDAGERQLAAEMIKKAGAETVAFAENDLELILLALKSEEAVLITEASNNVLNLAETLKYVTEHSKYCTVSVLADNWPGETQDNFLGACDVFVTRPLEERKIVPGIMVDAARKKRMRELEREFNESTESFAKDKNMSFAEHIIMDTLGLSKEGACEYIKSLAEKHGYDEGEVAKIVYEVLLAGGNK